MLGGQGEVSINIGIGTAKSMFCMTIIQSWYVGDRRLIKHRMFYYRLVCLTKVTPIFFHKATAKFISGLAKCYVDSKDCEVQIYWTFDMLIIHFFFLKGVSFLRKQGCLFLPPRSKTCNTNSMYPGCSNIHLLNLTVFLHKYRYCCLILLIRKTKL